MRRSLLRLLSSHHLEHPGSVLSLLLASAAVLQLAAAAGLAYVAGFGKVRAVLADFRLGWLAMVLAALLVSAIGYYFAYQGIFRVEGGPRLPFRQMGAVVAAGFGGLLAHGGELDQYALLAAGASEDEAKVRATGLAGLEHGVLAIGATGTAIVVLLSPLSEPAGSVTIPWAVLPLPGFLIAFWAAERYRDSFRGLTGWRGMIGIFLDSIHIIRALFVRPLRWWPAIGGMALFWAGDAFAAWAGLAAFGFRMNAAALLVGFATGMVFTRRTAPVGGAGVIAVVLPLTISQSGAPLAVAVVGVFVYGVASLWLPMPASFAVRASLRRMGERQVRRADRVAAAMAEPPPQPEPPAPGAAGPVPPEPAPGGPAAGEPGLGRSA
jgi:hypothetical protein